ncbi:MAG: signal peptidase I [Planctomyces sp.]|nr:signal peptidase I [Planctomyces sp.]
MSQMPPIDRDGHFQPPTATAVASGALRTTFESIVALLLAVLLFRTFAAEGFMISTGSMAPTLLGFHKRVACPKCHELFAYGTAWDESVSGLEASSPEFVAERAICPNCSQAGIDLANVPRNHGDQLLVNKQSYLWNSPKRWEVAVFRNPNQPTEAYVKRIVGLPGEAVWIQNGDLWINGVIERKSLETQRAIWIPVFNQGHRPEEDKGFHERWVPEDGVVAASSPDRGWRTSGTTFLFREGSGVTKDDDQDPVAAESITAEDANRAPPIAWVEYRHWIRAGGTHSTTVHLNEWPKDLNPSTIPSAGIKYNPDTRQLGCYGVLADDFVAFLKINSKDLIFHQAVDKLKEASHLAPITDRYGYNPPESSLEPSAERDIAFVADLSLPQGPARFLLQLTDGKERYTLNFDSVRKSILLQGEGVERPLRIGPWLPPEAGQSVKLEASIIDRQIALAVDGKEIFPAWPLSATPPPIEAPRAPVRFGASEGTVRVANPLLFRDVYYTFQRGRNGVNRPYQLGPDEYFVLGDNSPVSHDSRRWEIPAVHKNLLVGKPFLVHLPSQPGRLKVGEREWLLRLPDLDRVRFLR